MNDDGWSVGVRRFYEDRHSVSLLAKRIAGYSLRFLRRRLLLLVWSLVRCLLPRKNVRVFY